MTAATNRQAGDSSRNPMGIDAMSRPGPLIRVVIIGTVTVKYAENVKRIIVTMFSTP